MRPTENDLQADATLTGGATCAERSDPWPDGWPQTVEQFEQLVDAYLDRLVRFAHRRLGNLHDAEDVVQEVMVRAYARRSDRDGVSPVGPYLYRCVANACTDLSRKRAGDVRPDRLRPDRRSAEVEICAPEPLPEEIVSTAEECRRAESFLARLPEQQAEAIRLRVCDGLRLREIAEVLGCSTNTVCSRLRYGFQKLRRMTDK